MPALTLKSYLAIISALIFLFLLLTGYQGERAAESIRSFEQQWKSYSVLQDERSRLQVALIASLGYGGLIHHYDNYILRRTDEYLTDAWASLGQARLYISRLNSLNEDHGVSTALADLSTVVEQIGQNLDEVGARLVAGESSQAILISLDLDFERADRALELLTADLKNRAKQAGSDKANHLFQLHAALGLNGMIQAFKRYVILRSEPDFDAAVSSFNSVRAILAEYDLAATSQAEQIALEDVAKTIDRYETGLNKAKQLFTEGASEASVDRVIKVDDSIALRGLELLNAQLVAELDRRALSVNAGVADLKRMQSRRYILQVVFLGTLLILINLLMWSAVIRPLDQVTYALHRLAEGDTSVDVVEDEKPSNELGLLKHAFQEFKLKEQMRQDAQRELKRLALTDPLTGLCNRNGLEKRYRELSNIAVRNGEKVAFLMFDLDNFKEVNDRLGHPAGDDLLKRVARILDAEIRATDIAARLGGDEFLIVLYSPEPQMAGKVGERTIARIKSIFPADRLSGRFGSSVGVIVDEASNCVEIDAALRRVDAAMYQAKRQGKGQVIQLPGKQQG